MKNPGAVLRVTLMAILILVVTACNTPHPEDGSDSYDLSERQVGDCSIYMMRFRSVRPFGCSFRVALSGPCNMLKKHDFLKEFRSLLRENNASILKTEDSYFIVDASDVIPLSDQAFCTALKKDASEILGLTLCDADTSDGFAQFRISGKGL